MTQTCSVVLVSDWIQIYLLSFVCGGSSGPLGPVHVRGVRARRVVGCSLGGWGPWCKFVVSRDRWEGGGRVRGGEGRLRVVGQTRVGRERCERGWSRE